MMKSAAIATCKSALTMSSGLPLRNEEAVQVLHSLGYLYGRGGQIKRGLVLLLLAARFSPDNVGVLRTLTHLLLMNGSSERALAVISRLQSLNDGDNATLLLLKSRALWIGGQKMEARHCFREYLKQRDEVSRA
jgi:type III secretion protein Y